jgi:hypothetical protein
MACRDDFSFHLFVVIRLPEADGMNIHANMEEVKIAWKAATFIMPLLH